MGKGKKKTINAIRKAIGAGGHLGQNYISRRVSLQEERAKHITVSLKNIL